MKSNKQEKSREGCSGGKRREKRMGRSGMMRPILYKFPVLMLFPSKTRVALRGMYTAHGSGPTVLCRALAPAYCPRAPLTII